MVSIILKVGRGTGGGGGKCPCSAAGGLLPVKRDRGGEERRLILGVGERMGGGGWMMYLSSRGAARALALDGRECCPRNLFRMLHTLPSTAGLPVACMAEAAAAVKVADPRRRPPASSNRFGPANCTIHINDRKFP